MGSTRSAGCSRVSATSRRSAAVRRKRRGRSTGKGMATLTSADASIRDRPVPRVRGRSGGKGRSDRRRAGSWGRGTFARARSPGIDRGANRQHQASGGGVCGNGRHMQTHRRGDGGGGVTDRHHSGVGRDGVAGKRSRPAPRGDNDRSELSGGQLGGDTGRNRTLHGAVGDHRHDVEALGAQRIRQSPVGDLGAGEQHRTISLRRPGVGRCAGRRPGVGQGDSRTTRGGDQCHLHAGGGQGCSGARPDGGHEGAPRNRGRDAQRVRGRQNCVHRRDRGERHPVEGAGCQSGDRVPQRFRVGGREDLDEGHRHRFEPRGFEQRVEFVVPAVPAADEHSWSAHCRAPIRAAAPRANRSSAARFPASRAAARMPSRPCSIDAPPDAAAGPVRPRISAAPTAAPDVPAPPPDAPPPPAGPLGDLNLQSDVKGGRTVGGGHPGAQRHAPGRRPRRWPRSARHSLLRAWPARVRSAVALAREWRSSSAARAASRVSSSASARHSTASAPWPGAGSISSLENVWETASSRPSLASPGAGEHHPVNSARRDHAEPGIDVPPHRLDPKVRPQPQQLRRPARGTGADP